MGKSNRPEHTAPPEIYYNDQEAQKYTSNSRIIYVQNKLTQRALELLNLADDGRPRMLLDLGCGSGLSGLALAESNHHFVGVDISQAMLDVAVDENGIQDLTGDVVLGDLGQGLPFRKNCQQFDGAISISAVQWLCNADKSGHDPRKRLKQLFHTLNGCLVKGARAVLQLYPENTEQAEMITRAAIHAGFHGGLVVDYPHSTRAKKYFLVLMVGAQLSTRGMAMEGEEDDDEDQVEIQVQKRYGKKRKGDKNTVKGVKEIIFRDKERRRQKGQENLPNDSRYSGRKRKQRF
eukprot:TRINITY_DN11355_c0_g1_i8.p1 TRINITY_DN11355_c0_g1~~TRINITY_DN11355_c0_g1_i8.p1  ORF type:complete len:291 (+),score=56.73 TRINITY_DN11355_c0_g1_i8:302-1174(+)